MGASLTCGSDTIPVLLRPCSLIALRAALYLPPPQARRAASAHPALVGWVPEPELRGIRGVVQFFRQSAGPCAGMAYGSPGRQGAGSFPTLFISLWLHYSFSPAKRSRVLLPQQSSNKLTDLARLPKLKPKFQFSVSVRTFRHLSQHYSAAISAEDCPALVTDDGSLKAFCPSRGVPRHETPRDGHC